LGRQFGVVLARVVEVEQEGAIDSGDDQRVLTVIEVREVDQSDVAHVKSRNNLMQLVHKNELELITHYQVESVLVREGNR